MMPTEMMLTRCVDLKLERHEAPSNCAWSDDWVRVKRILGGDASAFTALVHQYHSGLVRLARAYVSDRAAAEEAVQETWLGVLKGLSAFEGRSSLKTWIFRILVNRAKTKGIREARFTNRSFTEELGADSEPAVEPSAFTASGRWGQPPRRWDESTAEALILEKEALARVELAILALPARQRAVITLRDVEGLSPAEVCEILNLAEANQRVLLHRARSKVRNALDEYLSGERNNGTRDVKSRDGAAQAEVPSPARN